MFDECMKCALEFDIWDDYGTGVTESAEECNLEINLVEAPAGSLGNPAASSSVSPASVSKHSKLSLQARFLTWAST